ALAKPRRQLGHLRGRRRPLLPLSCDCGHDVGAGGMVSPAGCISGGAGEIAPAPRRRRVLSNSPKAKTATVANVTTATRRSSGPQERLIRITIESSCWFATTRSARLLPSSSTAATPVGALPTEILDAGANEPLPSPSSTAMASPPSQLT